MTVKHEAAMKKKGVSRKRDCLGMKVGGCCGFRLLKLSPLNFLKTMAKAMCLWRRASPHQVSSSGRPTPSLVLTDIDSSSAIQDCIEFIHSAASVTTSDSLSSKSC
ncbi:hypothetical protein M5689_010898 [Euphorbia peplus]|nr:hypothetical protein M5689_010898 [Euphorbia peplus]